MSTLSTCHEKIFALKKEIELKEKEIYKFYEQAVKENIKLGAGSIVTDRTNLVKYKVSETIRLNYSQKKLTLQHVAARELDNGLTQWLYFTTYFFHYLFNIKGLYKTMCFSTFNIYFIALLKKVFHFLNTI